VYDGTLHRLAPLGPIGSFLAPVYDVYDECMMEMRKVYDRTFHTLASWAHLVFSIYSFID